MSLFGRGAMQRLRTLRARGSAAKGSFFGEGQREAGGNIFGETPPPPGQSRKWESWEAPWYLTLGASGAILYFGLSSRPDTSITRAADAEGKRRIDG